MAKEIKTAGSKHEEVVFLVFKKKGKDGSANIPEQMSVRVGRNEITLTPDSKVKMTRASAMHVVNDQAAHLSNESPANITRNADLVIQELSVKDEDEDEAPAPKPAVALPHKAKK